MKYNYNNETTYTTGEFADYFNIKKDTLLYYDKIGLFPPAGIMENGYRYYMASQIEPFRILLAFRELKVPIKILQEYFREPSPERLRQITLQQMGKIKIEIEKLSQIQNHLMRISQSLQEADTACFGKVQIVQIPSVYLIHSKQTDGTLETSEKQWEDIHDDFIRNADFLGITHICSVISEADLKDRNFDHISYLYAESLEPTENLRKGGTYAVYYHKGMYNTVKYAYEEMLMQIDAMGYTPIGNAYEEYLVSETATKDEEQYVTKIMIKIR